ncbi:MAG TPA: spore germination protein GerW family protein [Pyrinomonadaceae bacterium]|nr:spore germination protein GerW family protein [Pyrinomonadaceae bacterium]
MDLEKTSSADLFISAMAEKLGAVAKAATVFGEPVAKDGITVIPVAKARWGFGGGGGQRKGEGDSGPEEDGVGGGGGVQVTPVGFIEIKNDEANFRPIRNVSLPWIIVGSLAGLFLLRSTLSRK